ncbi:MAG TPA: YiiX/YebB-like N1pC/P60 family cysteine hydrolase, partial [Bacteroidia bacterium]
MRTKHIVSLSACFVVVLSIIALNAELKKKVNKKVVVKTASSDSLKNGDLIFQTNIKGQGRAIQLATKSKYTHIGIIIRVNDEWMVYEATQPVRMIPLQQFIEEGDSQKYVIKRHQQSDSILNSTNLAVMKHYLNEQLGKPYDPFFNWDDEAIYCSELVYKCYDKIGVKIGELKPLSSY